MNERKSKALSIILVLMSTKKELHITLNNDLLLGIEELINKRKYGNE